MGLSFYVKNQDASGVARPACAVTGKKSKSDP
jgi:hypothetical protein